MKAFTEPLIVFTVYSFRWARSEFNTLHKLQQQAMNKSPEVPEFGSMTDETITPCAISMNTMSSNPRLNFLMGRLVRHLHDFARETRLTTDEWMKAIEFLTAVGKTCTDTRQEFILLSDVLGLSVLVDSISNPKAENSTVGTLLGPFHTHDSNEFASGEAFCSEGKGRPCAVYGRITDNYGNPITNASVELWETDETGHYDTQYSDRQGPDCRGIFFTDINGEYKTQGIVPVSYPIPKDGPVGKLLGHLNRHPYRPAHIHFWVKKSGYNDLITALYMKGDKYENSDAVFGAKKDLIVEPQRINDDETAAQLGMKVGQNYINFDIVMMSKQDGEKLFAEKSKQALESFGIEATLVDGLPVAELD